MKLRPLVFALLPIVACSDDEPASASFQLSLTIVGEGRVTSAPAGFDCTGPSDCGAFAFPAGRPVTLTASAAGGGTLFRWTVDDQPLATVPASLQIAADAPSKRVRVDFQAAAGAQPIEACGADVTCAEGSVCCVDAGSVACKPGSCGDLPKADCSYEGACGQGEVCCLRTDAIAKALLVVSLTCEASASCIANGTTNAAPLCTGSSDARCTENQLCAPYTSGGNLSTCQTLASL